MSDAERPRSAALVEIGARPPSDPLAQVCLRAYLTEIEQRFGTHFNSGGGDDQLVPPHGLLLVAVLQGEPIGCGGLKYHDDGVPEIKRLWTAPAARGMGIGRRLLAELEQAARAAGATVVRLDTNSTLTEAMALYRSCGYREIARYNDNPHAQHWFEKQLA